MTFDNSGDGSWSKYINIPITTTPSEDVQYKVVIDSNSITIYSAEGTQKTQGNSDIASDFWNNVKSDGSDIRVFKEDKTQLYFWIEKFDSVNKEAIIWVRLPKNATELNIAYGNPSALPSNYNDGKHTFMFFDDFDSLDTSIWKSSGASVSNGVLSINAGNYYVKSLKHLFTPKSCFETIKKDALDFYFEEGIAKLGNYFYISTVDKDNGRGYIYKVDADTLDVVDYVDMTTDTRYHTSGISRDPSGSFMWVAVAEFTETPTNPTIIRKVYPDLTYVDAFTVNDHIGAICSDGTRLYMFNWDAQTLYVYDYDGNLITTKSRSDGGWGAIQDCYYYNGKIYGTAQDENTIYVIDASTLTVVYKYKIPISTYEGIDIDPDDPTIIYLLPNDGYLYTARLEESLDGIVLIYKIKQGGNTRRNAGFSEDFPCANDHENHAIEHSHDSTFEAEVLNAGADTPYKEQDGSLTTDYEVHLLIYKTDSMVLKNLATGGTIEITKTEAGNSYPDIYKHISIGFQTWNTADSPLYVDYVFVAKSSDPAEFGTPTVKEYIETGVFVTNEDAYHGNYSCKFVVVANSSEGEKYVGIKQSQDLTGYNKVKFALKITELIGHCAFEVWVGNSKLVEYTNTTSDWEEKEVDVSGISGTQEVKFIARAKDYAEDRKIIAYLDKVVKSI